MAGHGSKKVIYAALVANFAIAVTKFIASAVSGSSAMFAEGVHSLVDTGNQGLLLYGLARAAKPADIDHPFGYGKELYFYAFLVAIIVFALGSGFAFYEGIHKIRDPHEVHFSWLNYIVLFLAIGFESIALRMALKEFNALRGDLSVMEAVRRSKDPTVITVLFEDSAAMLGLAIALIGITIAYITGDPFFDAAATIGIAIVLAITALVLAIETKGLLTGEAASPQLVREIRMMAAQQPGVERINELLTVHFGPNEVLVTMSVEFKDDLGTEDIERTVSQIEQTLRDKHAMVRRVFIEAQSFRQHLALANHNGTVHS